MSKTVVGVVEKKEAFTKKRTDGGGKFMENVLTVNGEKYKKTSSEGVDPFEDVLEGAEVKILAEIVNTKGRDGKTYTNRLVKKIEVVEDSAATTDELIEDSSDSVGNTTGPLPGPLPSTDTQQPLVRSKVGNGVDATSLSICRQNAVSSALKFLEMSLAGTRTTATLGDVVAVAEVIVEYTTDPYKQKK